MRDLIEMTYKCTSTDKLDCHKCKYYKECLLCEILDVLTGNAPPIIDYPTPTIIVYADGEWIWKGYVHQQNTMLNWKTSIDKQQTMVYTTHVNKN